MRNKGARTVEKIEGFQYIRLKDGDMGRKMILALTWKGIDGFRRSVGIE